VFDSVGFKAGPLGSVKGSKGLRGLYIIPEDLGGFEGWSNNNIQELNRGWIRSGNSIEELAMNIEKNEFGKRMDAGNLVASINRYNELCSKKNDDDFGRPVSSMLPVNAPPYYAFAKVPGGVCTHGGPRRSARAEVLNSELIPIPRLFSAGELGSIYGRTYSVTGGNVGEASAFGRIAGRNAAAIKPWT
jgi:succinate dehydrogenase/fumarate reductase flavoprotein subunit